jgi:hypothetical protein
LAFLTPQIKQPKQPAAPRAPERSDTEIAEAAADQRRRLYGEMGGRRSTLGGGLDAPGHYATSSARLLGVA